VAVDSSNGIHVVWRDETPGNREIYYKRSTDGGATWNPIKRLTWTFEGSDYPDIAVDSGNAVHVIWYDLSPGNSEVYYRKSSDRGATWNAAKRLTWTSVDSYEPAVALGPGGTIHVVWSEQAGSAAIHYKRSTDGGATWSAAKRLSRTLAWCTSPALSVDSDDNVHVVWDDTTPENPEIYYRKSPDGGTSWNTVQRLTWTAADSYFPAVAADSDDHIHVVFEDITSGDYQIYYRRSLDGGASWSVLQRLAWTSGSSYIPAISTDSGNGIHVVWEEFVFTHGDIYYKNSPDGGTTWNVVKRLTWTSGVSWHADIAIGPSGNIYVVWDDNTPGNYEIYYKKGT
jgi:hypothetical protein